MIRTLQLSDINEVNLLLSEFNYSISEKSFENDFFRAIVYENAGIKGVIVYDLLYDRIEIEYIIVDKKYRENGIGTKLLNELEKHNIENITLEVKESNLNAIEFYKKNGFMIATIRKNYYGNEEGYLMLKKVGE